MTEDGAHFRLMIPYVVSSTTTTSELMIPPTYTRLNKNFLSVEYYLVLIHRVVENRWPDKPELVKKSTLAARGQCLNF